MKKTTTQTRYLLEQGGGLELVIMRGGKFRSPLHTHVASCVAIVSRAGRITLRLGDGRLVLLAGEAAIVPPHMPHSLEAGDGCDMAAICVRPDCLGQVDAFLAGLVEEGLLTADEQVTVSEKLRRLTLDGERDDSLAKLRAFLETVPEESPDLAGLAARTRIGKYRLIRSFKARYGLSPIRFLNQNRVRKARRALLEKPGMTQAALAAGFYDQSHFIRHFRRLHGMTPRQYVAACRFISTMPA